MSRWRYSGVLLLSVLLFLLVWCFLFLVLCGSAVCIQSCPALPLVPTPIQPMLTLSLAPRAVMIAGPAAIAADLRKVRRLSCSAIKASRTTMKAKSRSNRNADQPQKEPDHERAKNAGARPG